MSRACLNTSTFRWTSVSMSTTHKPSDHTHHRKKYSLLTTHLQVIKILLFATSSSKTVI
ncbi:hypothetical protein PAE4_40260 [Bacillus altitudinis]|nr:hypothetical protein PAE4_40260 [Bacillus altitudinis]